MLGSRGRPDTAHLPSPNPMFRQSMTTLPHSENITAKSPSKRNTVLFSNATESISMNGMYGIESPLQGSHIVDQLPRALPWALVELPLWGERTIVPT